MDGRTPVSSEADRSTFERALADVAAAPPLPVDDREHLTPGTIIDGCYRIVHRLGAGGMGVVYLAHDIDLDRSIAIKFKLNVTSETELPRMWREAKVMARLSHPNVMPVYEVGTFRGMVFIAMEYLDGGTAHEWVSSQERNWTEVLNLYVQAGRGLAAAHSVGVVHRDFKPDNVLVGADGRVRVSDFGLAHHLDSVSLSQESSGPDSSSDRLTRSGAALGTPAYMAPEQWQSSAVDARADQFSFCVALFEGLFGKRPFRGTSREMLRSIETAKLEVPARTTVPVGILRVLRRGLALDPTRRFSDMDALLEALRGAASRRARVRWAMAGLSTVGLAAGGIYGAQQLDEARRIGDCEDAGAAIDAVWNDEARQGVRTGLLATGASHAEATADRVMPWLDEHAEAWRSARTQACIDTTVQKVWSADNHDRSQWCLEQRRLELEALATELASADNKTLARAVQAAAGLRHVEPCRDLALLARLPMPPDDSRDAVRSVREGFSRTRALQATGAYDAGLEEARRALEAAEAIGWAPLIASAWGWVGSLLSSAGKYEEAETALEKAYFGAAAVGATAEALASAQGLVFTLGNRMARHPEAERWWKHAELMRATLPDAAGLREAKNLEYLGNERDLTGAYDEAEELYTRALELRKASLGSRHPKVAQALLNLALMHEHSGAYDDARRLTERAREIYVDVLGPRHPHVGQCLHQLANLHYAEGTYEDSRKLFEASRAIWEEALGPRHGRVGSSFNNQANVHFAMGQYAEAAALHKQAASIFEEVHGAQHPHVASSLTNLANVYNATGEYDEAAKLHEQALRIYKGALGPRHPNVASALNNRGDVYHATGSHQEAARLYEEALEIRREALPEDHPSIGDTLSNLAGARHSMGEYEEAVRLGEEALAIARKGGGSDHPRVATKLHNLALAHFAMQHHERAIQLQQEALALRKKTLGPKHPDVALALKSLGDMQLALAQTQAASGSSSK